MFLNAFVQSCSFFSDFSGSCGYLVKGMLSLNLYEVSGPILETQGMCAVWPKLAYSDKFRAIRR